MFRFAVRLFSIFLPSVDFFEGCVRTKRFDVHSHDLHPVVGRRDLRVKIIQNSDVRHARMVADVDHVGNVIRPAAGSVSFSIFMFGSFYRSLNCVETSCRWRTRTPDGKLFKKPSPCRLRRSQGAPLANRSLFLLSASLGYADEFAAGGGFEPP